MHNLLRRLIAATWYRHAHCPTVGCEPNWLERQMLGDVIPKRCRKCRRALRD